MRKKKASGIGKDGKRNGWKREGKKKLRHNMRDRQTSVLPEVCLGFFYKRNNCQI